MSIVSKEEIQNIRNNINIVDLISEYVPLDKKGKNYFGVCPFHDDNNPSMSVSLEKQIYTCFSCGATGNVFNFLMDYEHIDFLSALKIASAKAGIKLDISDTKKEVSSPIHKIYDISNKFFKNNLNTKDGEKAKEYLKSRKISDEAVKEFEIGLSLHGGSDLLNLLLKKEFQKDEILKSGLANKNERGMYDVFLNRIMFPLHDLKGNVIAYSGRDYLNKYDNKYVNTKETEHFKKGEILYNFERSKKYCKKESKVIVMEGFMDVIKSYDAGVKNTVATMGTAFTSSHVNLLKRLANEVLLCFDSDSAGVNATISAADVLTKNGIVPKIIILKEGMDPDDFIEKYGAEEFKLKIDNPVDLIEFKLNYFKKTLDLSKNEGLSKYISMALESINKIDDDILVEVSINNLAKETGVDKEFLKEKLKPDKKEITKYIPKKEKKHKYSKYEIAERNLVFYMLEHVNVIHVYLNKVSCLPNKKYRDLAKNIVVFYKKHNYINQADLITEVKQDSIIKTIGELNLLDLNKDVKDEEINDYVKVINDYNYNYSISVLQDKVKKASTSSEKESLVQEILEQKKRRDSND